MSSRLIYIGTVAMVWLIIGLAVLPPFLGESGSSFIVVIFDKLCHQLPGRSIHFHGESLAVCARCIAIYFGIGTSLLAYAKFRQKLQPSIKYLGIASAIMIGQWLFEFLAPSDSWIIARMITGLLFGFMAGLFLAKACFDLNMTPNPNFYKTKSVSP